VIIIILIEQIKLGQPANRALKNAGVETLEQLSCYTKKDLLALHGFGPKAFGILSSILKENGLTLKEEEGSL
jgi:DNA-directed RNA polymerase alpha subunit